MIGGRGKWFARTVVLVALAVGGCANPGRLQDLRDCGRVSVGVGIGLSANVKLGDLAHPSLGLVAVTYRLGHESRRISGYWKEKEQAFPAQMISNMVIGHRPFGMSYVRERWPERIEAMSSASPEMVGMWLPLLPRTECERRLRSPFNSATDLEVSVTALFVSARVGLNPLEIVDFVLGFLGPDIAQDDPVESARGSNGEAPGAEHTGAVSSAALLGRYGVMD